jgi:hypothetical protein
MKQNIRLEHGGHEQAHKDDMPSMDFWTAAEEDISCAVMASATMLGTSDFDKVRQFTNGADRSKMIIKLAELILEQRRFYIAGEPK